MNGAGQAVSAVPASVPDATILRLWQLTEGKAWEPNCGTRDPKVERLVATGYVKRCNMRCGFEALGEIGLKWTDAGRIAAKAIEARSDETLQAAQPEGQERGPKASPNLSQSGTQSMTQSNTPDDRKQLSACLARYMDLKAFTATRVGKEQAAKLKDRRDIANRRAKAAIRFFSKPENLERLIRQASRSTPPANAETGA